MQDDVRRVELQVQRGGVDDRLAAAGGEDAQLERLQASLDLRPVHFQRCAARDAAHRVAHGDGAILGVALAQADGVARRPHVAQLDGEAAAEEGAVRPPREQSQQGLVLQQEVREVVVAPAGWPRRREARRGADCPHHGGGVHLHRLDCALLVMEPAARLLGERARRRVHRLELRR